MGRFRYKSIKIVNEKMKLEPISYIGQVRLDNYMEKKTNFKRGSRK